MLLIRDWGARGRRKQLFIPSAVGEHLQNEYWVQELVSAQVSHSPVFIAGDDSKNIQLKF